MIIVSTFILIVPTGISVVSVYPVLPLVITVLVAVGNNNYSCTPGGGV